MFLLCLDGSEKAKHSMKVLKDLLHRKDGKCIDEVNAITVDESILES